MIKISIFDFLFKKLTNIHYETVTANDKVKSCFLNLATHTAVSYIANTISKCEIKSFDKKGEVKDKVYYKLNVSPNPNQNSSQFMNNLIENYFYKGEALVIMHKNNFYVCDDFNVEKFGMSPNRYTGIVINGELTNIEKYAYDCFHFKLDNQNVKNLLALAYDEYGKILTASIKHYLKKNGSKYKLNMENYRAGDRDFQAIYESVIKENLKDFLENDNAVYPQFKGFNLEEFEQRNVGNSASNQDIISMRKDIFEMVAQAFKVPVSMLLGNITNMNEIVKVYLTVCIDPLADMISEEFTRKMYTINDMKIGKKIKIDTSTINHIDLLDVGDNVDKLIATGTCSIDEVRERLNMEQLNTAFSKKHFITKNYENLQEVKEGGVENE